MTLDSDTLTPEEITSVLIEILSNRGRVKAVDLVAGLVQKTGHTFSEFKSGTFVQFISDISHIFTTARRGNDTNFWEAKEAMIALNRAEILGNKILIAWANPKRDTPQEDVEEDQIKYFDSSVLNGSQKSSILSCISEYESLKSDKSFV